MRRSPLWNNRARSGRVDASGTGVGPILTYGFARSEYEAGRDKSANLLSPPRVGRMARKSLPAILLFRISAALFSGRTRGRGGLGGLAPFRALLAVLDVVGDVAVGRLA